MTCLTFYFFGYLCLNIGTLTYYFIDFILGGRGIITYL